jgi:hypothetical protein
LQLDIPLVWYSAHVHPTRDDSDAHYLLVLFSDRKPLFLLREESPFAAKDQIVLIFIWWE